MKKSVGWLQLVCLVLFLGGCTFRSAEKTTVNLAIWSNYIPESLLSQFFKQTGIQVRISYYSSNEELLAKLLAGASGYDVVIPSDYMVYVFKKLNLLKKLDWSQLTEMKNLDPKFLKKNFDPENHYSLPYDWGTTGIAVNRKLYSGSIKSWKDLFTQEDLAGNFSLLDDGREVIGAALKSMNYSLNSKDLAQLQMAKALLLKYKKNVKAYTSEPLVPLVSGDWAVAQIFMSDSLIAREQAFKKGTGNIEYFIPSEGGTFWIDNLVIPESALHVKEAHQFINFLLQPQSNLATVMSVFVAPANRIAFQLLPLELKNNRMLFPEEALLKKCEMVEDVGDFVKEWDRAWTEIKMN